MALYVYGLMRTEDGAAASAAASRQLDTIGRDGLCALVDEMGDQDLALRRESALAHSQTLQDAFAHGPVLPLRFGTVLADAAALDRDLLGPRSRELLARLEALEGFSEMQVKARYLEEPLLRSILDSAPRLAEAAGRLRQLPEAAGHFDRIALGEAVNDQVRARRSVDSHHLVQALRERAVAVDVSEPTHEFEVLSAAFLVENGRLEEFDAAVEALSDERAEQMQLRLIGPMPPHSFADRPWEQELPVRQATTWD